MLRKICTRWTLVLLASFAITVPGQAAMVGTAQLQPGHTLVDSGSVNQQREWITGQLVAAGVESSAAAQRVAAMTDAQVARIHQRIDAQPAGGDGLVILILILVITELMGYTDIVPNWPAE